MTQGSAGLSSAGIQIYVIWTQAGAHDWWHPGPNSNHNRGTPQSWTVGSENLPEKGHPLHTPRKALCSETLPLFLQPRNILGDRLSSCFYSQPTYWPGRGRRNTSHTQSCAKELSVMWSCSISVAPNTATTSHMCLVNTETGLAALQFYLVSPEAATWGWWLLYVLFIPFSLACVWESEGEVAASHVPHIPWASLLFLH